MLIGCHSSDLSVTLVGEHMLQPQHVLCSLTSFVDTSCWGFHAHCNTDLLVPEVGFRDGRLGERGAWDEGASLPAATAEVRLRAGMSPPPLPPLGASRLASSSPLLSPSRYRTSFRCRPERLSEASTLAAGSMVTADSSYARPLDHRVHTHEAECSLKCWVTWLTQV